MEEKKKGIPKGCLITLAVVAGLFILIVLFSFLFCDKIIAFGLNKAVDAVALEIKANLPEEYTADEVDQIMNDLKNAIKDKRIDQTETQALGDLIGEVMEDQKVDQDEARRILEEVKNAVEN